MQSTKSSETIQKFEAMVRIIAKVGDVSTASEHVLRTGHPQRMKEGMIAMSLCRRAAESVGVACGCYGLRVDDLRACAQAIEAGTEAMQEFAARLCRTVDVSIEEQSRRSGMPSSLMREGMEGFVSELIVSTAMTIARAEYYLKKAQRTEVAG